MTERIPRAIRKEVRQRANGRCEYCHKPDFVTVLGFHVDHIIPILHGGSSEFDNLAWACLECNVNKGRDIASLDRESNRLTPLFHPRRDQWQQHFFFEGAYILGRTPVGRVTVTILNMNQPEQIEMRWDLINSGSWP